MQTLPLYHISGISGYRIRRIRLSSKYNKDIEIKGKEAYDKVVRRETRLAAKGSGGRRKLIISIERKQLACQHCGAEGAHYYKESTRLIKFQGIGRAEAWIEVDVHRIYCPHCKTNKYEHLEFVTNPRSRITRSFEKELVEARQEMSITGVAKFYGVSRQLVRSAEIRALELKYKWVPMSDVRRLGIDEICIFHNANGGKQYATIIHDHDTNRILNVSVGKGEGALRMFASRLKRIKNPPKIECVTMDMSNGYENFVKNNLPDATIVFDHFHVIKMINDILNKIRRAAMAKINAETRKSLEELDKAELEREVAAELEKRIKDKQQKAKDILKGSMKLPLMNREDIEKKPESKARLDKMLDEYSDLNTTYLLKERLRSIYATAKIPLEAKALLEQWIADARASKIPSLKTMGNTLEKRLEGVLGFWTFAGATNAKTEGFNNKIRWLVKQAYGYRDFRYFRLKVFDLPNIKVSKNDA